VTQHPPEIEGWISVVEDALRRRGYVAICEAPGSDARRAHLQSTWAKASNNDDRIRDMVSEAWAGDQEVDSELRDLAVACIRRREGLPLPLADFVIDALVGVGSGKKAKKRGQNPLANIDRDSLILEAVEHSRKSGLHLTRNEATETPYTACWIVAEAIARVSGKRFSESAIYKIWSSFELEE
jgi:hypothetical protein